MRTIHFCLLFCLLAFQGCADRICGPRLLAADAVMEELPDSARRLLLAADTAAMNPAERARRRVLMVRACNRSDNELTNDSLIRPALEYYRRKGSDADRALAWYCYGSIHDNAKELDSLIMM